MRTLELRHFPESTWPASGKARIWGQVCLTPNPSHVCIRVLCFVLFCFKDLFERETESMSGRGRGRGNQPQADSMLRAEPDTGFDLMRRWDQDLSGHPRASRCTDRSAPPRHPGVCLGKREGATLAPCRKYLPKESNLALEIFKHQLRKKETGISWTFTPRNLICVKSYDLP